MESMPRPLKYMISEFGAYGSTCAAHVRTKLVCECVTIVVSYSLSYLKYAVSLERGTTELHINTKYKAENATVVSRSPFSEMCVCVCVCVCQ